MSEPITKERRLQSIALVISDALLWTSFDDTTLAENAKLPLIEGLRWIALDANVSDAHERAWFERVLRVGWNIAPAADEAESLADGERGA